MGCGLFLGSELQSGVEERVFFFVSCPVGLERPE